MTTKLLYQPAQRIREKKDYDVVFNERKRLFGRHFVIYHKKNQLTHARLGIIVSKRNVRYAVDRNVLKRMLKESFRLCQKTLKKTDIVVVVKKQPKPVNKKELQQCIKQLLTKLSTGQVKH